MQTAPPGKSLKVLRVLGALGAPVASAAALTKATFMCWPQLSCNLAVAWRVGPVNQTLQVYPLQWVSMCFCVFAECILFTRYPLYFDTLLSIPQKNMDASSYTDR